MMMNDRDGARQQLIGTWLQNHSADGRLISAWELKDSGSFEFSWHRADGMRAKLLESGLRRMEGRWQLDGQAEPFTLALHIDKVKSPAKRVIDVAYIGPSLVNPFVFVFRGFVVGLSDLAARKLANAGFGVAAQVDFDDSDTIRLLSQKNLEPIEWRRH
jgi:hypothetical protein